MSARAADVAANLAGWVGESLHGQASADGRTIVVDDSPRSRDAVRRARYELLTRYITARAAERSLSCELTRFEARAVGERVVATRAWCADMRRRFDQPRDGTFEIRRIRHMPPA